MIFRKPYQMVVHICMGTTLAFFHQCKDVTGIEKFPTKNFQMYANSLLIIDFQFIFVNIKLITFFSAKKNPAGAYYKMQ